MDQSSTYRILSFRGKDQFAWRVKGNAQVEDEREYPNWLLVHYRFLVKRSHSIATMTTVTDRPDPESCKYGVVDAVCDTNRDLFYMICDLFSERRVLQFIAKTCQDHESIHEDCYESLCPNEHHDACIAGYEIARLQIAIDLCKRSGQPILHGLAREINDGSLDDVILDVLRSQDPDLSRYYKCLLVDIAYSHGMTVSRIRSFLDSSLCRKISVKFFLLWELLPDEGFEEDENLIVVLSSAYMPTQDELMEIAVARGITYCSCGGHNCEEYFHSYAMLTQMVEMFIQEDRLSELFVTLCRDTSEGLSEFLEWLNENYSIDLWIDDYQLLEIFDMTEHGDLIAKIAKRDGIYCHCIPRHNFGYKGDPDLRFFIVPELFPEGRFEDYKVYQINDAYMYSLLVQFGPDLNNGRSEKSAQDERTIWVRDMGYGSSIETDGESQEIPVPKWLVDYVNWRMSNLKKSARSVPKDD